MKCWSISCLVCSWEAHHQPHQAVSGDLFLAQVLRGEIEGWCWALLFRPFCLEAVDTFTPGSYFTLSFTMATYKLRMQLISCSFSGTT
jgi:hypothetical protein